MNSLKINSCLNSKKTPQGSSCQVTTMAESASQDLDHEFVLELPEDLTCPLCRKVLREPHQVSCCERKLCKVCLELKLTVSRSCPLCHGTESSHMLMQQTRRKVNELEVYCPNKVRGCKAVLKISELGNHLSATGDGVCLFIKLLGSEAPQDDEIVPCSFSKLGCAAKVCRKDLERHCESNLLQHVNLLAKSHKTLQTEHRALAAEHGTLQKEFKTLQPEHQKLLSQHKTVVSSFLLVEEQFKARVPEMKYRQTVNQYSVLTHMSSTRVAGPPIALALSELNVKAGHHYFKVDGRALLLEWTYKPDLLNGAFFFTLFLVQGEPAPSPASAFDVEIRISDTPDVQLTHKRSFACCCLNARAPKPKDLLGAFFGPSPKLQAKVMLLSFHDHQPSGCSCHCHKK